MADQRWTQDQNQGMLSDAGQSYSRQSRVSSQKRRLSRVTQHERSRSSHWCARSRSLSGSRAPSTKVPRQRHQINHYQNYRYFKGRMGSGIHSFFSSKTLHVNMAEVNRLLLCLQGKVDCFTLLLARHLADVSCFIGPSMPSGIYMEIHTKIVQKRKKKQSRDEGNPRQTYIYL